MDRRMGNGIDIPEDLQGICKELAKVALANGLHSLSGKFNASTDWVGEISFNWTSGRHNEDSNNLTIYSQFTVTTKVNEDRNSSIH